VRITHLPTGIVVQCQPERSQHKNRAKAWACCGPLYEAELKKREEAANATEAASKTEIGWGHQIRSYVLQPYQLVKDLRTGVESTSPQTCSTAISTSSWKPRSPSASTAAEAEEQRQAVRPECIATVATAIFAGSGDTATMKNAAAMVR
jgi:hypothetical protein